MSPIEIGIMSAICLTTLITLYGLFRFVVAAFQAGIGWGLGVVLVPLFQLVFLFVHWQKARRPFGVMMAGSACSIALAVTGPMLLGDAAGESRLAEAAKSVTNALPESLAAPGSSVAERFASGEIDGCPDGALLMGSRPPEGSELWCELGDGTRHGPIASWHPNRLRATAGVFRDGQRTGQWLRWNELGELQSTAMFEHDLQHGPMIRYGPGGEVVSETLWQYGEVAQN